MKPFLFLDVDGPLNPWAAKAHQRPEGYETHRLSPPKWIEQNGGRRVKPLRVWLNPSHGPALVTLTDRFELVWATTWEHEANEFIGPRIGLRELPVVHWHPDDPQPRDQDGTFWKTRLLTLYADRRPFAWVDDDITAADTTWIAEHHRASALPLWIDPAKGLLPSDFGALAAWAAALIGASQ